MSIAAVDNLAADAGEAPGRWKFIASALLCCATAVLLMTLPAVAQAEENPLTDDRFNDLLASYKSVTRLPERVRFHATEQIDVTHIRSNSRDEKHYVYKTRFSKDSDRISVWQQRNVQSSQGQTPDDIVHQLVIANNRAIEYRESKGPQGFAIASLMTSDLAHQSDRALWAALKAGRILEGFLGGNGYGNHIADLMASGREKRIAIETDDTFGEVYILEAETKYGKHKLWLDAETMHPRRMERYKKGADVLSNRPLRDRGYSEHITIVDAFEFETLEGQVFPVAVRLREVKKLLKGGVDEELTLHRRSKIELSPDFRSIDPFVPRIPEGTLFITPDSKDGLSYEWHQGDVRIAIDPQAVVAIDGAVKSIEPFPRRSRWLSHWLIVLVAMLALCVSVIFIWRSRRRLSDGLFGRR